MTIEDAPAPERSRSQLARVGVAALNVFHPGIGLLRLGEVRSATLLISLPIVWAFASIAVFAVPFRPSFAAIMGYAGGTLLAFLALYVAAIILTWRRSAAVVRPLPWFARWYVLVATVIGTSIVFNLTTSFLHTYYKPFYMPSESMAPTLGRLDRIIADMRAGRHPRVGDIVLIRSGTRIYVKRVIALPGDRVALEADVPIVDGVRASVEPAGMTRFLSDHDYLTAMLFHERLPGETATHDIVITRPTSYGDFAEQTVPPGHIFVLGDNRERSADSRLPPSEEGVGMVPLADISGQPLYITWRHDGAGIGRPVSH